MTGSHAGAFLALWNGISRSELQPEYETWHTFEHVPERMGLPGFIEARRYRSPQHPASYFTCYWLTSCEALSSPQYSDVVKNPTQWSACMRDELRDFHRLPCELGGGHGNSSATQLATLQLRAQSNTCAAELEQELLQRVDAARLVCAHWGLARPSDDFPVVNAGHASSQQDIVVMLQHIEVDALRESAQSLVRYLAPVATVLAPAAFFELLSVTRQDELVTPLIARQPARPELRHRFTRGDNL